MTVKVCTQHKALEHNLMNYKLSAAQLIDLADTNNPRAAAEVAALAETMGQLLEIPAWQLKRLR